jgi:predicted transcriptional regulator of viral defense system
MHDTSLRGSDYASLFTEASAQHGYFTTKQAAIAGYSRPLLTYHAKRGRFVRVSRGLYRLRDYPSSLRDEVAAAWLSAGPDDAVVSHESALDLLDLSDVIPNAVHLTVPRSRRFQRSPLPGTVIHTTIRTIGGRDVTMREGIRLTSAERSILDAAETGTGPEQIEMAIRQAMERGWVTAGSITRAASTRSHRVRDLVTEAVALART